MKQHITRAYNTFSINDLDGTITKSSPETRLSNEINYYRDISATLHNIHFPRYVTSSFEEGVYHLELEYYAYDNLGDFMVYGDFEESFWVNVASSLDGVLKKFSQTTSNKDFSQYAEAMYIDKTQRYYTELLENPKFAVVNKHESLKIDGKNYLNFDRIWEDVQKEIKKQLLPLKDASVIHGDMCFSNILCAVNEKTDTYILKFVDPRGNFGEDGIYGDPLYDYAKLVHSYNGGYEYIIYDQFAIDENHDLSKFDLTFSNDNKTKISTIFQEFDDPKATLIEGLIYIGMCSRHYDSLKRQTAMYTTGIRLLNEALEK